MSEREEVPAARKVELPPKTNPTHANEAAPDLLSVSVTSIGPEARTILYWKNKQMENMK